MATYAVKSIRSDRLSLPRHQDAPLDVEFRSWCRKEQEANRPLAVDLFSGAGGLGAGVEAAGWTVAIAVDNDQSALETHLANFRGRALNVDMSKTHQVEKLIKEIKPLKVDLIVGGPPCQPFSRAGRAKIQNLVDRGLRNHIDQRKELWRAFIHVVLAVKPRAVMMENVPDMAIGDDLIIIRKIADRLEKSGYNVDYRLLDAWRHGIPQHRKRFILQARNDGVRPTWPSQSDQPATVRDAIEDLPQLKDTIGCREQAYHSKPNSELGMKLRDINDPIIYDHMTRPVRADDKEAFHLMDSTTLYSDLPENLRRYRADTFNDKYKRLGWDEPSRTITAHIAKDGYWYIHPSEDRTLTVREAARIQTFPDSFRFAGTRSDAFRQIGNAVPPLLGQKVSEEICASVMEKNFHHGLNVAEIRKALTAWATKKRRKTWWLFPGPDMKPAVAAFATMLNVHQLLPKNAEKIMNPFRGEEEISLELLKYINIKEVSQTRKDSIYQTRELLMNGDNLYAVSKIIETFSPNQKKLFSILSGKNELVLNENVRRIVPILMELPSEHSGLLTDIKVALAQMVGLGKGASLRMCAIKYMSAQEARTLIYLLSPQG